MEECDGKSKLSKLALTNLGGYYNETKNTRDITQYYKEV